jgi:mRNA-degrading endonuclease toxin of MazEF toxin-antitoxin module
MGNLYGNTITVVPLTSGQKRLNLPTHIEITPDDIQSSGDYLKPSTILTEQIITIDKSCLKAYIGRINSVAVIGKIYEALRIQLAI